MDKNKGISKSAFNSVNPVGSPNIFRTELFNNRDWEKFRDFYLGVPNPQQLEGLLEGKDLQARDTWIPILEGNEQQNCRLFAMWDKDKIVGSTLIQYVSDEEGEKAILTGSLIDPEYRGRGLADHLYNARLDYLKESGFDGQIQTFIHPDNKSSLGAARRNGFVDSHERHIGADGQSYITLVPKNSNTLNNNTSVPKQNLTL